VGVEDPVGQAVGTLFWVGLRAWNNATKDPLSTTFTLDWQRDAAGWNTLAAAGELKWAGNNNMVVTDPTPATGIFFCSSCGGNAVDGAAVDDAAACTLDIASGDDSEWWWGIDSAGATAGSTYTFRVNDDRGQFTNTLLAASITFQAPPVDLVMTDGGASHLVHTNGAAAQDISLIIPLTVAGGTHLCDSIPENITVTETVGAIDLVMTDGGATHVVTSPELPATQVYPDDCSHVHTAPNLPATQVYPDDCVHLHSAPNLPATQVYPDDCSHLSDSIPENITLEITIVPLDCTHVLSSPELPATQVYPDDCSHLCDSIPENITIQEVVSAVDLVMTDGGAQHVHSAPNLTLVEVWDLTVQGSSHVVTSPEIDLGQHFLTTADSSHAHGAPKLTLSIVFVATVQGATHVHPATTIDLAQNFLSVADSSHLCDSIPENIAIVEVGDVTLTMHDASHVVTSPELPATQVYPDSCTHSHLVTPTNLTLVEVYTLTIAPDPYHVLTDSDPVWFVQTSIHQVGSQPSDISLTLTISVDACVHVLDDGVDIVLVQLFDLVMSDAGLNYHVLQSIPTDLNLAGIVTLTMTDGGGTHLHSAPSIDLTSTLNPADCTHVHSAPNLTITQDAYLAVVDNVHLHLAPRLTIAEIVEGMDQILDAVKTLHDISTKRSLVDLTTERTLHRL
jgi:hypothetical protein